MSRYYPDHFGVVKLLVFLQSLRKIPMIFSLFYVKENAFLSQTVQNIICIQSPIGVKWVKDNKYDQDLEKGVKSGV